MTKVHSRQLVVNSVAVTELIIRIDADIRMTITTLVQREYPTLSLEDNAPLIMLLNTHVIYEIQERVALSAHRRRNVK